MKKIVFSIVIAFFAANIAIAQTDSSKGPKPIPQSMVEKIAKNEAMRLQKQLGLNAEQVQQITALNVPFVAKEIEMRNSGVKFPPGPVFGYEKLQAFKNVLTNEQADQYKQLLDKERTEQMKVLPKR